MKTFETEKGNIPEGATHYSDEAEGKYFCWYNINEEVKICVLDGVGFGHKWHRCTNEHKGADVKPIPSVPTETPEEKEALDAIEQVEWKNGDIVKTPDGMGCLVAEVFRDGYSYWIVQFKDNFHPFCVTELSKPETEAERVERERLEAVKEMFSYWSDDEGDFVAGDDTDRWVKGLLFSLYDAGYKRGGL